VNFSPLRLGVGFAFVLALASVTAGLAQTQLPPPPVPAVTATPIPATPIPAPTASPSAGPRRGKRAPQPAGSSEAGAVPSETPQPPQFSTLDGIWEVELQPLAKRLAVYSHLNIAVTGSTISGYWEHDPHKTKSKMTGTFDGRLIQMNITMPDGTTAQFSGYVEGFSDMVGLFRANDKDPGTAFTAQHRKKLKI
jgi:hypothetical protein